MSEKYLILHKVSGQPAFDIATKLETEEEVWIVETSGHRAYPFQKVKLDDLLEAWLGTFDPDEMPSDWPDHYQNAKGFREPSVDLDFAEMMKALVPQGSFPRRA